MADDPYAAFSSPVSGAAPADPYAAFSSPAPAAGAGPSSLADAAKALPAGLARGETGLLGMIPDIAGALKGAANKYLFDPVMGQIPQGGPQPPNLQDKYGSAALQKDVASVAPSLDYRPQTTAGKYANTIGEMLPGAALVPGGVGGNLLKFGVIPGAASEAAGEATQGTGAEPYARMGGAILGGGAAPAAGAAYERMAPLLQEAPGGMSRTAAGLIRAGMPPDATGALSQLGPEGMLLDTSPQMLGLAQGAAAKGPAADALVNALRDRQLGQSNRLLSDLGQIGSPMSPMDVASLVAGKKAETGPMYNAAFERAPPVDISGVLSRMGQDAQNAGPMESQALGSARQWLTEPAPAGPGEPPPMAPGWAGESTFQPEQPTSQVQPKPTSLVTMLQRMGGVNDDGGNLAAAGFDKFPGLIRKSGVPMDKAREAAAEQGYLGPNIDAAMSDTTIRDFVDTITEHPTYSIHDQERVAAMHAKQAAADARDQGLGAATPFSQNDTQPPSIPPAEPAAPSRTPIENARQLANIKQDLDAALNYPTKGFPAPGALSAKEGANYRVRTGLNDALQAQVPGYESANRSYATAAKLGESYDTGRQMLSDKGMWPDEAAANFNAAPLEQQAMMRHGGLSQAYENLGQKPNDLSAVKQVFGGENDFNRAKAGMLFGNDARDNMLAAILREGRFADAYNKVAQGSQTAQRLAGSNAIDAAVPNMSDLVPKNATWGGMLGHYGEQALRKGFNAAGRVSSDKVRSELASALTGRGADQNNFANALSRQVSKNRATRGRISGPSGNRALAAALNVNAVRANSP